MPSSVVNLIDKNNTDENKNTYQKNYKIIYCGFHYQPLQLLGDSATMVRSMYVISLIIRTMLLLLALLMKYINSRNFKGRENYT